MKRKQLYLSTIDENAHLLAEAHGFGIELAEFCTPWYLDTEFDRVDPLVRQKLRCSDRFTLHAPFSELFPCAIDPKVRAVAAERYRQVIDAARRYGAKKVVVHGGYNPHIYFPVWYTEQSVVFWREFVREIPADIVFCLENVLEEEPAMLAEVVRQVDDPRVRLCLDVGHISAYAKAPLAQWLAECAGLTEHFHLHNNDGSRDSHSQLFQGSLPIEELLKTIEADFPAATATLELMDAAPSVKWLLDRSE